MISQEHHHCCLPLVFSSPPPLPIPYPRQVNKTSVKEVLEHQITMPKLGGKGPYWY